MAALLADALASPRCRLQTLQLASNTLPVRSVVRLARAIANNTVLRTLGLANNNVGAMGARALLESAASAGSLVEVSVTNAGVGGRWQAALQKVLRRNAAAQRRSATRRRAALQGCAKRASAETV